MARLASLQTPAAAPKTPRSGKKTTAAATVPAPTPAPTPVKPAPVNPAPAPQPTAALGVSANPESRKGKGRGKNRTRSGEEAAQIAAKAVAGAPQSADVLGDIAAAQADAAKQAEAAKKKDEEIAALKRQLASKEKQVYDEATRAAKDPAVLEELEKLNDTTVPSPPFHGFTSQADDTPEAGDDAGTSSGVNKKPKRSNRSGGGAKK